MTKQNNFQIIPWLNQLAAVQRLLVCLVLAVLTLLIFFFNGITLLTSIMMSWEVFSLFMIGLSWLTFFTTTSTLTFKMAVREDESRSVIFVIVLISVLISLFGIIFLNYNSGDGNNKNLNEALSMIGVALSWFLLHTIFTLHYAHIFYGDEEEATASAGGLIFPGETHPDYLDLHIFFCNRHDLPGFGC